MTKNRHKCYRYEKHRHRNIKIHKELHLKPIQGQQKQLVIDAVDG